MAVAPHVWKQGLSEQESDQGRSSLLAVVMEKRFYAGVCAKTDVEWQLPRTKFMSMVKLYGISVWRMSVRHQTARDAHLVSEQASSQISCSGYSIIDELDR